MKILHVLNQRPEATGSGIYTQAMIRESARRGHENFLLAGVAQGEDPQLDGLGPVACDFVRFQGGDLPFDVVGMSDVMPYPSRRFSDLSLPEVEGYEWGFADRLLDVVARFQPQVIHSHHLWLLSAAALEDRVQVWGPQSQEELARLMGQAHLVVLASFFEGLPLVVLEALACGCRVVTTALPGGGGSPKRIRHRNDPDGPPAPPPGPGHAAPGRRGWFCPRSGRGPKKGRFSPPEKGQRSTGRQWRDGLLTSGSEF